MAELMITILHGRRRQHHTQHGAGKISQHQLIAVGQLNAQYIVFSQTVAQQHCRQTSSFRPCLGISQAARASTKEFH